MKLAINPVQKVNQHSGHTHTHTHTPTKCLLAASKQLNTDATTPEHDVLNPPASGVIDSSCTDSPCVCVTRAQVAAACVLGLMLLLTSRRRRPQIIRTNWVKHLTDINREVTLYFYM